MHTREAWATELTNLRTQMRCARAHRRDRAVWCCGLPHLASLPHLAALADTRARHASTITHSMKHSLFSRVDSHSLPERERERETHTRTNTHTYAHIRTGSGEDRREGELGEEDAGAR